MAVGSTLVAEPVAHAQDLPPVAKFTWSYPDGPLTVGTPITLDASESYDPERGPLTYSWEINPDPHYYYDGVKVLHRFDYSGLYNVILTVKDSAGHSTTVYDEIDVSSENTRPDPMYTPLWPFINAGDTVTFKSAACCTHEWVITSSNPGFPVTGTGNPFEYKFDTPGVYGVKHTVTDDYGATSYTSGLVTVNKAAPVARFTRSPSTPTVSVGTKLTFDASSSTGDIFKYNWYVDDKSVASVEASKGISTFEHTFTTEGPHRVSLRLIGDDGAKGDYFEDVTVVAAPAEPPVATFSQTPTAATVAAGTEVTFDGSASTGEGLKYAWYVRGQKGVVSTNKILKHTFKKAGDYGIQLVVTDTANQTAKKWTGLTVTGTTAPPVAKFSQTPTAATVAAGTEVTFDGSASTGEGLKYAWYVRGQKGVVSTNKILKHTFKKAGDYGIQLVVTDAADQPAKQWTGLTVTGTNSPPTVKFTQAPSSSTIKAGTAVTFDGSTSSDPDGDQLKYYWFVRGHKGVVSTNQVLNHTFKTAGDYGVELRVVDPTGAISKKWVGLTVTN